MKRKLLSILLTLCLAFSLLPTAALAATVENCPGDESCTHQAAIGSTHYDTLQEAINAAQKGDTITVLTNIDVGTGKVSVYNKKSNVVLDLGGHTVTGSGQYTMSFSSVNWTIQNGTVENTAGDKNYGTILFSLKGSTTLGGTGTLTIKNTTDEGVALALSKIPNGTAEVTVSDGTTINGGFFGAKLLGPTVAVSNKAGKAILNIEGGEITGGTAAIAVYGASTKNPKAGVIVNVTGGRVSSATGFAIAGNGSTADVPTTINISGGEVVSATDTAIYHPQAGTLTVSGGTISGVTGGIQMCSGNLVVTGGTIAATGNGDTSGKTGDGSIPDGAAVSVVDRGYPGGAPTATITDGTLTSANDVDAVTGYDWSNNTKTDWVEAEDKDQLVVTGGTFSSNVTKFVPAGFEVADNSGTYRVGMAEGQKVVILDALGNQLSAYNDFESAFAAAKNGQTLKLLDSISSDRINLEDKSIVVDFNGKTLTSTAAYGVMFCAKNGNKITVNGTTEGSKLVGTLMVTSGTDGHIEVNGGTYENSKYCPIYINGAVNSENSTLTVKNATITASGTDSDQDKGCAVYLAGYCTSTFKDTTVTAPVTGIEIRAGKLTLTNCDVTGGNGEVETNANGNGTTVKNAALAISQHTTKKPIDVTINGGTFTGKASVYQTDVQNTGSANVKASVKNGNFNGMVKGETNGTIAVSGGTFDKPVKEEYCANNYIPKDNDNGTYGVKRGSYIAQVNDGEKFETLQAAVDAASDGNTITLLKNCTESVTVSGKSLTIDKNNHGYDFAKVTVDSNSTKTENDDILTITYTAPSSSSGSSYDPTYSVSTPSKTENGSVTVSPKNASKGDTVTVTVKPDSGYVLETLTVTDKNGNELTLKDKGNGKYTFTMPAGKVEVKATFMEDNSMLNFFYDVPNDAYFYEAVKWAVENGITTGVGNDLFAPEQPCTRAQIVTFLWRAAGSPEPKGAASGMTDVVSGSYYEKAVAWAIENGITTGTTTSTFSPDATCTRAQAVTFLARAMNAKAASAAEFSDVPTGSYFADAVAWAAANGVTEGIGGGLFGSDNDCTRGQIVTFLYRAYNK